MTREYSEFERELRHDFSNRQRALRRLSSMVAGLLSAMEYEEVLSADPRDVLTDAQFDRLEWAWDEVRDRLYKMGGEG